jgi:N-carbamoyl-L-amino-acid hydrolase
MRNLPLSGARLWAELHGIARIGATPGGGCNRQALTDPDAQARAFLAQRAAALGCTLLLDRFGNMGLLRAGTDPARAPIAFGSHLDTQPTGGKYDGVLGVLAGLELLRALHESGGRTAAPLLLINWTNEEGARFAPPMMGSGAALGLLDADAVLASADAAGARFGAELARIGWQGADVLPAPAAYFELHIEQGPLLERAGVPLGVVTHALAQRWYDVTATGAAAHAGSAMAGRRDALMAAAALISELEALAEATRSASGEPGRVTIGTLALHPASRNVAPGRCTFSLDTRHQEEAALAARGVAIEVAEFWHAPHTPFDPRLCALLRAAAARRGLAAMDMAAAIGHDAVHAARRFPAAMLFVPCHGGLSHNEAESITQGWAEAGLLVLADAVMEAAQ